MHIITIASKEVNDSIRNRWIWAATIAFTGLAVTAAVIGSIPTGEVKNANADVVLASLASLSVYLVPLISLLLTHDAIVSEREDGTLLLLLTYPVARLQIFLGKFLGNMFIVCIAVFIGYGAAIFTIWMNAEFQLESFNSFLQLFLSAVLMGSVFIALGMFISLISRERATAVGFAIGIWLFFVVIYDLALLGVLVIDKNQTLDPVLLSAFLMLNPADAFRTFNIAGIEGVSAVMGLSSVSESFQSKLFLFPAVTGVWLIGILSLGLMKFRRYEI